jgi:hypothetical protein
VGAEIETGAGDRGDPRARRSSPRAASEGTAICGPGPAARDMPLRANTNSVGDGLRLGFAAGAALGEPNAGFYGHLIPAKVP